MKRRLNEEALELISKAQETDYYVDLDFPIAHKRAGYFRTKQDLQFIIRWLYYQDRLATELPNDQHQQDIILMGLWFASVVTYAKCFTDSSKGKNRGKLEKKDHLKGATEEMIALHDHIMKVRHTYISHGIENEFEYTISRLYITPSEESNEVDFRIGSVGVRNTNEPKQNHKLFKELVQIVISNVDRKLEILGNKVREEIRAKGPDYWVKQAIKNKEIR
jgi:hypothetical protein